MKKMENEICFIGSLSCVYGTFLTCIPVTKAPAPGISQQMLRWVRKIPIEDSWIFLWPMSEINTRVDGQVVWSNKAFCIWISVRLPIVLLVLERNVYRYQRVQTFCKNLFRKEMQHEQTLPPCRICNLELKLENLFLVNAVEPSSIEQLIKVGCPPPQL